LSISRFDVTQRHNCEDWSKISWSESCNDQ
jgi:hypothetical protein